jgi:hypothetical protein
MQAFVKKIVRQILIGVIISNIFYISFMFVLHYDMIYS